MRKIIAVTGARSEYDLLVEVYKKLDQDSTIDFSIVVTGAHLSETYGYTAKHIEEDGFKIAGKIHNLVDSNQKIGRIISLGNQIQPLAELLDFERPDLVLIAGDREEAIAVTMTTAYLSIPSAHFFGGDIAKDGNIDNAVRYAASKFASIHFPTLEEHRQTLLKLGEDAWRIHVVGNPALDRFLSTATLSKKALFDALNFNKEEEDFYVLIQHPIITEVDLQAEHIRATLDALVASGTRCFINYPNSDAGNHEIIEAYKEYAKKHPQQFCLFQNLDRITYINLLRHAKCLLGNSSSGIVEVASLGLPVVNIGKRQKNRISSGNVVFVNNQKDEIIEALTFIDQDTAFKSKVAEKNNIYGDGTSSDKIVKVLKEVTLNDELIYKNITY